MISLVSVSTAALAPTAAFPVQSRVTVVPRGGTVLASDEPTSRRALLSSIASAGAAAAVLTAVPATSFAESTLVTRQQAYSRYVPRIERGRDFWAGGLRKAIGNQDWAFITRELEPVGKNKG